MGAAASVRRSPVMMQAELDRLRSKEMDLIEEHHKTVSLAELKHEATVTQLEEEKFRLVEELRDVSAKLNVQREKWEKEHSKALSLMFSDLPLQLFQAGGLRSTNIEPNSSMTKIFPMVTATQCDIVGFSSISTRLPPEQAILVIDQLHTLIDEAFSDRDIFIMERTSDGCVAVSGLIDPPKAKERALTSSVVTINSHSSIGKIQDSYNESETVKNDPAYHADILATAALKLLSYSTKITVPLPDNSTLQLRIALHSGPCSAGVIGLQTTSGASRVPRYKLLGPTIQHLHMLCSYGLALQIRVSKQCQDLLVRRGGFLFERCPDCVIYKNRKLSESYWLVAKDNLPLKLPSLSDAISLSDYDI